tara:strand:- start:402 stop:635 length:234 start_codon:yes stop_codon:yes gene_type:complete
MIKTDKLILITEVIEQKIRKEKELAYYHKELEEIQKKIGFLQGEVQLTTTIIGMIKHELIYDIKQTFIDNNDDKLIR